MEIARGRIVTVAESGNGDYGAKPRVALVLQSDLFNPTHPSVTVAPITTLLRNDAAAFRLTIEPSADNGLRLTSQVMIDKVTTFRREKVRTSIGAIDPDTMVRVTRALALWFGIG